MIGSILIASIGAAGVAWFAYLAAFDDVPKRDRNPSKWVLVFGVVLVSALTSLFVCVSPGTEDYTQGVYDHANGVVVVDTLSNGETVISEVTQ